MSWAGSLLGIVEIAVAQEHLLPRFEGWHPEVGAAGTAESIAQVALLREEIIIPGSLSQGWGQKNAISTFIIWPQWPEGNGWVYL